MMFTLYRDAPSKVRASVSENLGVSPVVLESCLVMLNTVRNICTNHGRLWNRTLGTKPKIPNRKNDERRYELVAIRPDRLLTEEKIVSATQCHRE